MRVFWPMILFLVVFTSASAFAVQRSDLSPEARKLLPEKDAVTVLLKNGKTVDGIQIAQSEQSISVRVADGAITSTKVIGRAEIKEVKALDVATSLAQELKRFQLDTKFSYPAEKYQQAIALFDEFLQKCTPHAAQPDIQRLRDAFAADLEKIQQGMEKINGNWETPIRGAIMKFELHSARLAELRTQYSGIETPNYKINPKAKTSYEELETQRRDVARNLPKLMRDRTPLLLEDRKFDEAVAEVSAFLKFWVTRVMASEAATTDRIKYGDKSVFEGMDFNYIVRLEKQIVSAYTNAVAPLLPTGQVAAADGVVIPGGYFLAGREDAGPADNDFPLHIASVAPFIMDKREVSNKDYRKFLEHVQRTGDSSMEHPDAPPLKDHTPSGWKYPSLSRDNQPVVGVDWFDAYAYAKWAGKRLPTEAEWERAARDSDGRLYTWGNDEAGKRLVNSPTGRRFMASEIDRRNPPPPPKKSWFGCMLNKEPEKPPATVLPDETWDADQVLPPQIVTNTLNAMDYETQESVYGVLHLAGNAAEWVGDWYEPGSYVKAVTENPRGPENGQVHVFRGGSYLTDGRELTTTSRGVPLNDNMKKGCAERGQPMIGIRCVKDIPSTAK
jgi:formylglycine-generating enzyme required for sulfatase activity